MLMYFTEKLADRVPPVPSMVYNLGPDFPCLEVSNYLFFSRPPDGQVFFFQVLRF